MAKSQTQEIVRIKNARIAELEEQLKSCRGMTERLGSTTHLEVDADELPVDYKGHIPRRVEVSLRPDLRRKLVALHQHLRSQHAVIRHPRYHEQTKHVDDLSHVVVWVLERVVLRGSQPQEPGQS